MPKLLCVILIGMLCIAGCGSTKPTSAGNTGISKFTSSDGLKSYIKEVPCVETVETWKSEYGDGLIISTPHYEIYTTLREPLTLKRLPGFMESAYRGYQEQLPYELNTVNKFEVYLFATRQQWEDFTKSFTGQMSPVYLQIKAGAYYLNGACVAYNLGMTRTFSVIGHEGWHQFSGRYFKYRLPSWIDEGIATLFEASRYKDGMWTFEPERNLNRLGGLKMTLLNKKMLPVNELIALNPGQVLIDNDDAVMGFYAQAYGLVRFLREEKYGKRLGNFHQLLIGAARGSWPLDERSKEMASDRNIQLTVTWNSYVATKLFQLYISKDFNEIQREYELFCNKSTYRIRIN